MVSVVLGNAHMDDVKKMHKRGPLEHFVIVMMIAGTHQGHVVSGMLFVCQ